MRQDSCPRCRHPVADHNYEEGCTHCRDCPNLDKHPYQQCGCREKL